MTTDPPDGPPGGSRKNRQMNVWGLAFLGSQMVGFTVFGIVLDSVFKAMPLFTISMTLVGLISVMVQLVRAAQSIGKASDDEQSTGRDRK